MCVCIYYTIPSFPGKEDFHVGAFDANKSKLNAYKIKSEEDKNNTKKKNNDEIVKIAQL